MIRGLSRASGNPAPVPPGDTGLRSMLGSHKKTTTNKRNSLQKTKKILFKSHNRKKKIQYCNKQKIQSTKDKGKTLQIRWFKYYNRKKKQPIQCYSKQNKKNTGNAGEKRTFNKLGILRSNTKLGVL